MTLLHAQITRMKPPLALAIREYREMYALTQEQLASDLSIDVRTLRRWENGETILNDVRELRRIATLLGLDPERLGVVKIPGAILTCEEIDKTLLHIWKLIDGARSYEADRLIGRLIEDLTTQIENEDPKMLYKLAQALHLGGYVKSVVTRSSEAHYALHYYTEMERVARLLQNDTLINIALTYEGDMYCRKGEPHKGIQCLEAARDTTPHADISSRGNGIQLLGRAYLRTNQLKGFAQSMAEAEELAHKIDPQHSSTQGQYSPGTVYEEYGRSYTQLGKMQQALDYLAKAEKCLEPTKHWEILLKTARATALVHGGELQGGVDLALESIQQCQEHGTIRLMERIYGIQKHLDHMTQNIGRIGSTLREALAGPIEY